MINKSVLEEIALAIGGGVSPGRVLVWGAHKKNDDIVHYLRGKGIEVCGYIDRFFKEIKELNNLPVYGKEILNEVRYCVFVALEDTYPEVIEFLDKIGYREFSDYWYPSRKVVLDGSIKYSDIYGNEYNGENYNFSIELFGGGKVTIGKGCEGSGLKIKAGRVSNLYIGDRVIFKYDAEIDLRDYSDIYIGNDCTFNSRIFVKSWLCSKIKIENHFEMSNGKQEFNKGIISASIDSNIVIKDQVSIGGRVFVRAVQRSIIEIGEDCMLSGEITVMSGNGHNLYSLDEGKNLDIKGKKVKIGEHVWVGRGAVLLHGCCVGAGSVIGMNSFVNKSFSKNCCIAGNPARIVRERIVWHRESERYLESYNDFEKYDYIPMEDCP